EPPRVDEREPPLRIVRRGEVGPRCPLRRRTAAATGDVTVAADDAVDLIRHHASIIHRPLTGQDGISAQRLVHRDAVPAATDRRVPDPRHRDLAAVPPHAEPTPIPPPPILIWRRHGCPSPLRPLLPVDLQTATRHS